MQLGRQFSWISAGRLGGALFQAATLIIVARFGPRDAIAVLTATIGLLLVAQTVADFGISTYTVRSVAAGDHPLASRGALHATNVTSLALAVAAVVAGVTCDLLSNDHLWWLIPLGIGAALEKNIEAHMAVALATGQASANAKVLMARRTGVLVMTVAGLALGLASVAAFALANLVSNVVAAQVAHRDSRNRIEALFGAGARTRLRATFANSRPYFANSLATQIRNLDALIAFVVGGPVVGAAYGITSRLMTPLRIIPTSLAQVLMPAVAREGIAGLAYARRILWWTVGLSALGFGICAALVPTLLPAVIGDQFSAAIVPLQIALVSLPVAAAASLSAAILQGLDRPRPVAVAAAVGSATCIVGVAIGANLGGANGAAVGLAASFVIQAALLEIRMRGIRP